MPGADCKSNQVRQIDAAAVQSRSDVYATDPCFLKVRLCVCCLYSNWALTNRDTSSFWLIWFINQRALYNHALSIVRRRPVLASALASVHTSPWHRVRYSNFIFGTDVLSCPYKHSLETSYHMYLSILYLIKMLKIYHLLISDIKFNVNINIGISMLYSFQI